MRLVVMLSLIAGASSLQVPGMHAVAPSLRASPQWSTRCSLHAMSEAAGAKPAEAAVAKAAKAEEPKEEVAAPRQWNPIGRVLVEQLNAKSKATGNSVIDELKAIVAKAGEDFKAGLASAGDKAGEDFKAGQTESARILGELLGLAIVSAAALFTPSLSTEFKWTFSALGFASAVYWKIRRALPAR